ncbi:bifunctional hydroxymethylpyrimidine kinase/phosphomethylpyrimidine kinase [Parapontixanthobacter aurantiacus]|uniref:bifunctional hydroxymethylpyrimidine kinase/phosphomethylpyrimidine kinase n=1 Tax=Parapontixanthobacter aurantiacus TaxID=1463599 RepID=UPI00192596C0|nr:bifunctional hydroxymethylpyrimidine kinase/phosphomethylpyrimidine kinase [Parapontixanthobacter aurantiacus]
MISPPRPPRTLCIAGSDSSGGAGIQADIKTVTMLGGYAMTAITAVTAQNSVGVQAVVSLQPDMVAAQIDSCVHDIGVDAVKIGMLGSAEIASLVADRLEALNVPIIFDPVMVATSGSVLADEQTIASFERLMKIATLVTPNLPELLALTKGDQKNSADPVAAAGELARRLGVAVLLKGGHAENRDDMVNDWLLEPNGSKSMFGHERIATRHTHGTGCTLSSGIACLAGHGQSLENAVRVARQFVLRAIENAPEYGSGSGPLGHQAVRKSG